MHGEDQNFGLGRSGPNLARRLNAVDYRQSIVYHSNVRFEFNGLGDRLFAIGSIGHNLTVRLGIQQSPQPYTDHGMIIGNKDARHRNPAFSSPSRTVPDNPKKRNTHSASG